MIEFKAPVLPSITGSSIDKLATNFPLDGDIEIYLNKKPENYINWRAEVNPPIEFDLIVDSEGNKIVISPKTRLKLSTDYEVKLFMSTISYNVKTKEVVEKTDESMVRQLNFKTDTSALISSVEPSGDKVLDDAIIRIKFGREVDHAQIESRFATEPVIEGDKIWEDGLTFKFTPKEKLTKDTTYKIKIMQGLEYQAGIRTKEDMVFDFKTIGRVKVNKFNVANNAQRVSVRSTFSVEFDQEVDKASAEQAFSMSSSVKGTFSWNGNKMSFKPASSLGYSKSYTVTVKPGIKSIRGLDSDKEFKVSFKTEPELFMLSVPYYRQEQRFECELLAARMVFAYRGIYMSETQIMREIGVSTVPYNSANNTWGDPNVYFVGDVTGASKGYGVHLDPIARVARAHGIAREVQNGNPVIILWQNGWSTPTNISWNTPEGKRIHAINGTHAGVVVGFKGSVDAPTAMIVQDPWYRGGPRRTYSISSFNALWNYHGRSALVIY